MAYIKTIKDNELIDGQDNSDVYPISTTQAIFSQLPDGSLPPGIRHSRLEERLEDHEALLAELYEMVEELIGGNVINITVEPSAITYGATTTVSVSVTSAMVVDYIKIYRNASECIYDGKPDDGKRITVQDAVKPSSMVPVRYTTEVKANGITKTAEKEVTINKGAAPISWSKSSDIVNVKDAASHVYPTLSNPKSLPVTYTSTNASVASIDASTGVITLHNIAGTAQIKAVFAGNEEYSAKTVSYTLTVTAEADYYVGWWAGNNPTLSAFAALTTEQLLGLSNDYSKISNPSITKVITNAEAIDRYKIFFLMWKDGSAPIGGRIESGGITETLDAEDFVDDSVFRATHTDVVIDNITYHVHGIRGAFDAGDKFIVNF